MSTASNPAPITLPANFKHAQGMQGHRTAMAEGVGDQKGYITFSGTYADAVKDIPANTAICVTILVQPAPPPAEPTPAPAPIATQDDP